MSKRSVLGLLSLVMIAVSICFVMYLRNILFFTQDVSVDFYRLLDESNQEVLDLSKLNSVQWDELVFWPPYGSIC